MRAMWEAGRGTDFVMKVKLAQGCVVVMQTQVADLQRYQQAVCDVESLWASVKSRFASGLLDSRAHCQLDWNQRRPFQCWLLPKEPRC